MSQVWNGIRERLSKVFYSNEKAEQIRVLEENLITMQSDKSSLIKETDELKKEADELKNKIQNFNLVKEALDAEPRENNFINEFASLIENNFKKDFCDNRWSSNGAENLRDLDNILKELRLIANCPELHSKSIGAIGGGFSSGKSSLINSFFTGKNVKLAVGTMPVTAIPSYVINSEKDSLVNGISFKGGKFPIALDVYAEISHEFMKFIGLDLNKIINYITVLNPMDSKYFNNLCLIDTPGYDPASSGSMKYDSNTARKYIENAEFLIWTVGLDTNGTIPKSDINFLMDLDVFGINPERHLYVVANKAQLKKQDDIEQILDKFEETLDENDLSYVGISAYNSQKREIHSFRKCDLFEFLSEHNKPSKKYPELKKRLFDIFKDYFLEANNDYENKEKKRKEVKKLILNALASGNINAYSDDDDASVELESGLNDLVKYFQSKEELDKRINNITILRDKFLECLNNFCETAGIERTEVKYCEFCGEPHNTNGRLCIKCSKKISGAQPIKK